MLGVWGFAMLLSPTVGDLLEVALRHGHGKLSWIFMRPALTHPGGAARLELDASELTPDLRRFVVERDLMSTATAIRGIVGGELPLEIETSLPVERRTALRHALPAVVAIREVSAGGGDAFVFGPELLGRPLPMADPTTAGAVERQCVDLAARRADHAGLAGRIRTALLRTAGEVPTLAGIAAERHVDPRTLRRQLDAEGTSFRALREEVRHRVAVELLSTTELTVAQVSERLGYSDPASFSRAFRRWTGRAPGSVRPAPRRAPLAGNAERSRATISAG
jgi:AraC-like DNA-binding protein